MNLDTYQTIKSMSQGVFKAKGSKFLSFAYPVETEGEVKVIIADLKKAYYDARHHCYAYILGSHGERYRENDDGEPSGTAGKPICGQLRSKQLTNTLVAVVRYFGGTKLGTSGLIEAYKTATLEALQNAQIIEKTILKKHKITFEYEQINAVMKIMKEFDLQIIEQDFGSLSQLVFEVRLSDEDCVLSKLQNFIIN